MTIAARLPPEIEQRLMTLAKRTGRSKASSAREAIERFLDDPKDEQLATEPGSSPAHVTIGRPPGLADVTYTSRTAKTKRAASSRRLQL